MQLRALSIFEKPAFQRLSDYQDLISIQSESAEVGRAQFIAYEKSPTVFDEAMYDARCFILMREGLFRAQVEKAMSELMAYFLGCSTSIEIIQEQENYYVRSRRIRNFKTFDELLLNNALRFLPDGKLVLVGDPDAKPITGLGAIAELAKFFRDKDSNLSNFGIQTHNSRAVKIDNEKGLDFSPDEEGSEQFEDQLKKMTKIYLGRDVTECEWYQQEQLAMRVKLAQVDFNVIEHIIRKHITSNQLESIAWLLQRFKLAGRPDVDEQLAAIQLEDPKEHGADKIVLMLRQQQVEVINNMSHLCRPSA